MESLHLGRQKKSDGVIHTRSGDPRYRRSRCREVHVIKCQLSEQLSSHLFDRLQWQFSAGR